MASGGGAMTVGEALRQAVAHHQASRFDEAAHLYRAILEVDPTQVDANHNLGLIEVASGRPEAALALFQAAIDARGDVALFHLSRGNVCMNLGRLAEAAAAYGRAAELDPDNAELRYNLGVALKDLGRLGDAIPQFQRAIALKPDLRSAYNNLGISFSGIGRFSEAVAAFRSGLALKPKSQRMRMNLGNALMGVGELEQALAMYESVVADDPDFSDVRNNIALLLKDLGRADEAMVHYRRALELKPNLVSAHRNLLLAILYQSGWSPEARYAEHQRFEEVHARPLYPEAPSFAVSRDPNRPLRVGYVSSDFREHPVGRNLLPLIEAHDRAKLLPVLYAHLPNPDGVSQRFKDQAHLWRDIAGMTDAQAAELIRADQIDVLVILAARFDLNRPLIAAHRPAPVQVSFHDGATSGLSVMDAIVADRVMVPPHGAELFAERPLRLPSFYLHLPIAAAPPVAAPPRLANGFVTFGSFNNPSKLSDETLALWGEVLRAVPQSRLVLKYKTWFATPSLANRVTSIMASHGVEPERLSLLGHGGELAAHMADYNLIDIALDPFPFTGSTTSFEALWMGIPVVTLAGEAMIGRWSASMLRTIGLGELVAQTPEQYVEICAALAANPNRLGALRGGLRRRVRNSPLCDARLKARHLERGFGALFRRWLARSADDSNANPG